MMRQRIAEISNPSPDRLAEITAQYEVEVQETLARALAECASPIGVFSKMRGMFPSEVILRERGRILRSERSSAVRPPKYHPELHALDYEWYFTNTTARSLSHEFASESGLTICLGAPRVAAAAIRASRRVVSIDKNPCVLTRFPVLNKSEEVHIMDATDAGRIGMQADVVVFDSPWYLPDTIAWLLSASKLIKRGGSIVFALYPPLVRATAKVERELVLEIASSMGAVEIQEDGLVYETPLFEHEALEGSGLRGLNEWRRADLVRVAMGRPMADTDLGLLRRPMIDGTWRSFVIGDQVVKVRSRSLELNSHRQLNGLLRPLGDSFLLESVSVGVPQRKLVDVWTSRNRVAASSDTRLLSLILRRLARGESLRQAVRRYVSEIPTEFEHQMHDLLALEAQCV